MNPMRQIARHWRDLKDRLAPADPTKPDLFRSAPFIGLHISLLWIPSLGFGAREAMTLASVYLLGMFFITAGYHRYFSHRAFKTSRFLQFVMAFFAQATGQKGVLWWSSHHRHHHRASDTDDDTHSPRHGLWWSHVGWMLCNKANDTRMDLVPDLARYPELRWLDRWPAVPVVLVSYVLNAVGGAQLLIGGYFLGIVVLFHATSTINSLAHVWGSRRYPTRDDSRNNLFLALLTLGEGWHNNHHHRPSLLQQGHRWWEIDVTTYLLRSLAALGLVWDLRMGPTADRRPLRSRAAWRMALVAAFLLFPSHAQATETIERYKGVARSSSGEVLYRETHEVVERDGKPVRAQTVYYDTEGKVIGRLKSDFTRSAYAPDYTFADLRAGIRRSVRLEGDRLLLAGESGRKVLKVPSDETLVTGQGLHHFTRLNLEALTRGQKEVRFALPARLDTYGFRIRPVGKPRPGVVRLRVEADSWILRLLAPYLEVDYEIATRRLLRYKGVSNLEGEDGEQPEVVIHFTYPEP